jgi:hypothetical protein
MSLGRKSNFMGLLLTKLPAVLNTLISSSLDLIIVFIYTKLPVKEECIYYIYVNTVTH